MQFGNTACFKKNILVKISKMFSGSIANDPKHKPIELKTDLLSAKHFRQISELITKTINYTTYMPRYFSKIVRINLFKK
jgi:hypothetical protein